MRLLAQEAPDPILPETNDFMWSSLVMFLLVALIIIVAVFRLVRYVRETRRTAEEALERAAAAEAAVAARPDGDGHLAAPSETR
jgi:flagellar biosynthesis/type III secretory pathway M-ring protein FliF/YscJ